MHSSFKFRGILGRFNKELWHDFLRNKIAAIVNYKGFEKFRKNFKQSLMYIAGTINLKVF